MTNACDISDLFSNVISNPKFLYSAFYSFTNEQVVDFFNKHGLPTKVERGKRVFPASDKSSDVIRTLEKECKRLGVAVLLHTEVKKLQIKESEVIGSCSEKSAYSAGGQSDCGNRRLFLCKYRFNGRWL